MADPDELAVLPEPIVAYAVEHICRDHVYFTDEAVSRILQEYLKPISLSHYPSTYLSEPKDDDPLPSFLSSCLKSVNTTLGADREWDEPWTITRECAEWVSATKKTVKASEKVWKKEDELFTKVPYKPAVVLPEEPILTRRAIAETPSFAESTFKNPSIPTTYRQVLKLLRPQTLAEAPLITRPDPPPLQIENVLNLHLTITQQQADDVTALIKLTPLPPTKKELKKKNPILTAHEERKKTLALALDSAWTERSSAFQAKIRDIIRPISPPIFPRLSDSRYYASRQQHQQQQQQDSSLLFAAAPFGPNIPKTFTEIASFLHSAIRKPPQYRPDTGELISDAQFGGMGAEEEFDELDEDPTGIRVLDSLEPGPHLPSDVNFSPPTSDSVEPGAQDGAWNPMDYLLSSESGDVDMEDGENEEGDGMLFLSVPLISRSRMLVEHRADAIDSPSNLQQALTSLLPLTSPAQDSQQPTVNPLHLFHPPLNEDEADEIDQLSPSYSPSRAISPSMLGQASIEANGILSKRPASRVPAGDRVVTMLLQSLPGGKEALKWEAEDWAGRETLQGWDEESIEVPKLPDPRSYFSASSIAAPRASKDLVRIGSAKSSGTSIVQLRQLSGLQSLDIELSWRLTNSMPSELPALDLDTLFDSDSAESLEVNALVSSFESSILGEPVSLGNGSFDKTILVRSSLGGFGEEEGVLLSRREEEVKARIRKRNEDGGNPELEGGKRQRFDDGRDKEDEQEEEDVLMVGQREGGREEGTEMDERRPMGRRRSMREMSEESQGLEGVEPMEDVRWDLSSSDSLHASPTRVHYHHDGRSGSPPTVPRPPAVPSASASAPYRRASLPSTTRPTGSNLDPIIPSRFRIQPHPSPSSSSRTADSQSTSTLAHFLSTRSHSNSVLPARPIIMAVPLCQQQQQQQQQWRQQNAPAAATLASSASVEPPPNAKEYETVLGSAQTRALASARRDGGWVHVIGGSKILQNRAACRILQASNVEAHFRTHSLLSLRPVPPSSTNPGSSPPVGLDLLLTPLHALLLLPLNHLPSSVSSLLSLLPLITQRFEKLFVVLTIPPSTIDLGLEVWTPPVRAAIGKLRRGAGMLAGKERERSGDGETDEEVMVGMDVVTGWVEEGELGELVKGLVARFGRREAGPSVLNGMDEIEREDSSDSADVEENEALLADMPFLNPFAAAYILAKMSLDDFMKLDDASRSQHLGNVIGFGRMERINRYIAHRRQILNSSSASFHTRSSSPQGQRRPPSLPPSSSPRYAPRFIDDENDVVMGEGQVDDGDSDETALPVYSRDGEGGEQGWNMEMDGRGGMGGAWADGDGCLRGGKMMGERFRTEAFGLQTVLEMDEEEEVEAYA